MSLFIPQQLLSQSRFLTPQASEYKSYSDVDPDYAHLDSHQKTRDENGGSNNIFEEVGTGLLSGAEGFFRSSIGFADMLLFDALPESWEERTFDRPDSVFGGLVEGVPQFGLGLIPGLGTAGLLGKGAKILGASDKILKTAKGITAGVTADFIAFDEHEARLSDFLVGHDATRNTITEYLASDEEDSAFEGRMKNVLEGGALGALGGVLIKGAKALKKGKKVDGSPESLQDAQNALNEVEQAMIDTGEVTRDGLDLLRAVDEKLGTKGIEMRRELNEPNQLNTGGGRTEVDPTSPLPKHPDC